MKLSKLVAILKAKTYALGDLEVEFIVCTKEGKIIAMELEHTAYDMSKIAALFGKKVS